MHLQILTPNEILFSGKVECVEIPTLSWTIGILPHHMPLTTIVSAGTIKFVAKEKAERILDAADFLFENEYTMLKISEGMLYLDGEMIKLFVHSWIDENVPETFSTAFAKAHLEIKRLTKSLQTSRIKTLRRR